MAAFQDLISAIGSHVSELKALSGDKWEESFQSMDKELTQVETKMSALKSYVQTEKKLVAKAQVLQDNIASQLQRVTKLSTATRAHLPGVFLEDGAVLTDRAEAAEDEENRAPKEDTKKRRKSMGGEQTPRKKRHVPVVAKLEYVSVEELKKCPAYVKGRLTVDRVNAAVDELQGFFSRESTFMAKGMSDMSNQELSRYNMLRNLDVPDKIKDRYNEGFPFVLLTDLSAAKHCKQDATGKAIFQVLRHLGRLSETPIQKGDRVYTIPESVC